MTDEERRDHKLLKRFVKEACLPSLQYVFSKMKVEEISYITVERKDEETWSLKDHFDLVQAFKRGKEKMDPNNRTTRLPDESSETGQKKIDILRENRRKSLNKVQDGMKDVFKNGEPQKESVENGKRKHNNNKTSTKRKNRNLLYSYRLIYHDVIICGINLLQKLI